MTPEEIEMLQAMMKRLAIVDQRVHSDSGIRRVKIEGYLYPAEIKLMERMFNDVRVQP